MKRLLKGMLYRLLSWIPGPWVENLVRRLVQIRLHSMPAREALLLLLRLDEFFYRLQGQQAVAYGEGVHTKHRHIRYHDFFVERVEAGQRVLDIGCGIGALAYDVAEKAGACVLGIDLDEKNIAEARERFAHPNIEYRVGDALKEIPQGPYDVVILSNILEHLPGRPHFLRKVQEASGARRILLRVPLFERDWRVPLKKELGVEWRLDSTHCTEYTQESFAEEMASAGLKISYQEMRWGEIWAEVVLHDAPD